MAGQSTKRAAEDAASDDPGAKRQRLGCGPPAEQSHQVGDVDEKMAALIHKGHHHLKEQRLTDALKLFKKVCGPRNQALRQSQLTGYGQAVALCTCFRPEVQPQPLGTTCQCNKVSSLVVRNPLERHGMVEWQTSISLLDTQGFTRSILQGCRCPDPSPHCASKRHLMALDGAAAAFLSSRSSRSMRRAEATASSMIMLNPTAPEVRIPRVVIGLPELVVTFPVSQGYLRLAKIFLTDTRWPKLAQLRAQSVYRHADINVDRSTNPDSAVLKVTWLLPPSRNSQPDPPLQILDRGLHYYNRCDIVQRLPGELQTLVFLQISLGDRL